MNVKFILAMKNLIYFLFFAGVIVAGTLMFSACNQFTTAEMEEPQSNTPLTAEEKDYVVEAHKLGVRLYATARKAEQVSPEREEQQKQLQPVYTQIEDFIFRR